MSAPLLEICVDTASGLAAAIAGGADRIELCSALTLGGLTPGAGLIEAARASPVPVRVMIRPRAGGFVFSQVECDMMRREIDAVRAAGLSGVVIGAGTASGGLDLAMLATLAAQAQGMQITLHRVVDLLPDGAEAVDAAMDLGFATILTSGGAIRAEHGLERIAAMQAHAAGRMEIVPGSGVSPANIDRIVAGTGVHSAHASCARSMPAADARAVAMGFTPPRMKETHAGSVAELRRALRRACRAVT